jgi:hypothetical protein
MSRAGLDAVFGGSFTIEIVYKLVALVHLSQSGIFTNYGPVSCSCPAGAEGCTPHCLGILQQSSNEGGNNVLVDIFSNTGRLQCDNFLVPTPSAWHHLTVVYDNSDGVLKCYVNGELKEEATATRPMDHANNNETFNHPNNDFYLGRTLGRYHDG